MTSLGMSGLRMLGAALALLVAGCTSTPPPLPEASADPYLLGPGDEIRVAVFRLNEMSNTYRVSDSGTISIPLLETMSVVGKPIEEVKTAIESAIAQKNLIYNPSVSAEISQYRPFFVIGEVNKPGQYSYAPKMTVLTALSMAGGPTFRASTDKVVITRVVDGKAVSGRAKLDSLVLPGDTIRVYEGWF